MAINYAGSLYFGPAVDNANYYSYTQPTLPANQSYTLFWIVRLQDGFGTSTDYNALDNKSLTFWGTTIGAGTSGNDCYFKLPGANYLTTSTRLKPTIRLAKTGIVFTASGGPLASSVALERNKIYTLALRYDHNTTTFEMVIVEKNGSAVLAASGAANSTFTGSTRALGSAGGMWIGRGDWANEVQAVGYVTRAVTNAELESIAAGADLESVITSAGDRGHLLLLDAPASTITATWGSGNATRNGTWTDHPTSSPMLPTAGTTYLSCNEPKVYQPFALSPGTSTASCSFSGVYNGFTPSAVEGKVIRPGGTVAVDWTPLSGLTAGAGVWSGTLSIPIGSGNVLLLRDGADHSKAWSGSHPFLVCPACVTIGQSPHAILEVSYSGVRTLTGEGYIPTNIDSKPQIVLALSTNVGAGYCETINQFSTASGGKPVLLIPVSVTGTSSADWATGAVGTWSGFLARVDASLAKNLDIYFLNGASDVGYPSAGIKSNHDTILANLDTDITGTRSIPYRYIVIPHNRQTSSGPDNNQKVRRAQTEWALQHAHFGTKVFRGVPYHDIPLDAEVAGSTVTYSVGVTNDTITLDATNNYAIANLLTSIVVTDSNGSQTKAITAYNNTTRVATISGHFSPPLTGTVSYVATGGTPHEAVDGAVRMGQRFGQFIAYRYGLSAITSEGPTLTSVTYPHGNDGSIIDLHFTHKSGTQLRTKNGGTAIVRSRAVAADF